MFRSPWILLLFVCLSPCHRAVGDIVINFTGAPGNSTLNWEISGDSNFSTGFANVTIGAFIFEVDGYTEFTDFDMTATGLVTIDNVTSGVSYSYAPRYIRNGMFGSVDQLNIANTGASVSLSHGDYVTFNGSGTITLTTETYDGLNEGAFSGDIRDPSGSSFSGGTTINVSPVPEPSSAVLLGLGTCLFALRRRHHGRDR